MAETTIYDWNDYIDPDQARIDYADILEYNFRVPADKLSDEQVYSYLNHIDRINWDDETSSLCSYMPTDMYVISRSNIGRSDSTSYGIELSVGFSDLLYSDIWKDCDRFRIWDEDGSLHMTGYHHDGAVSVEVKCVSEAGEQMIDDWYDKDIPYDLNKIWNDPKLSHEPRYAENILGVVSEDKALEKEAKGMSLADRAAGAKEVSSGMEQDAPQRDLSKVER